MLFDEVKQLKLSDIQTEWSKDSIIDKTELTDASLNVHKLHSKYMNILNGERMAYRTLLEEKKKLIQKLEDYYNGKIDGKDIGRDPWQLTESRALVEKRIEMDKELIDFNLKTFNQEEKVLLLKEVISSINQMSFNIRNAIEMIKFNQGGL